VPLDGSPFTPFPDTVQVAHCSSCDAGQIRVRLVADRTGSMVLVMPQPHLISTYRKTRRRLTRA
jgi:hypothetical protein